ncbi:MAG TPA: NAD(P)-binding domain-containing protein [Actinomycetota bacterium]|jgi:putative flavoprotein involved in K+ transport
MDGVERFDTMVIGGGQAGLMAGYHLRKAGVPFVILDGYERVGDAWRNRWDSLRLFTPKGYDRLPGWKPSFSSSFPTKDEMADYLERYAERFEFSIRTGVKVDRLTHENGRFVATAGERRLEADRVIVATGAHHTPKVPAFAANLDARIVQMHSNAYRNPSQLREGGVLLVGAGNSGAEIAVELSRTRPTWLAGPDVGHIPVRHGTVPAHIGFRVFRFMGHHVMTRRNPIGRKLATKMIEKGDPLIRIRPKDLAAAGVERVSRVTGVREGLPVLEDGRTLDVTNVVWCTGYRSNFSWIDLPIFDAAGLPMHTRGVVDSMPGMYFVGLVFQFALSSDVLPGGDRDARYVVKHLAAERGRARDLVRTSDDADLAVADRARA